MASMTPPRIGDVARLAGVATSTVSKALNDTGRISEETRARVRQAAEELGFVPHAGARSMHAQRTFTVGLLSTDSAGRFSLPIVLGAENALIAGRVSALLATARHDPVREQHHIRALVSRRVDGIIVTGRSIEPRPPIEAPVPVVYAYSPSEDPADTSVVPDDDAGMRLLVSHLHGIGARRVAYVGGRDGHPSTTGRLAATRAEAEALGMELVGEPRSGEWSEWWGRRAVDLLVGDGVVGPGGADAILFASDQLARGGSDRLRELGIRIPEDIAVTGYDDWQIMSLAARPPLTTVDMRLEALGTRAAELLLAAIEGERHEGVELHAPRLVGRQSTLGE
ncbi:LacI family DNA-binding transcriptional regulator [Microbacterium indicum]|uniref:LacI family DNA-binding transcriptional regulator n=1 Tax=Microbacterium indicum TaxID=358100 RepID=UPI0004103D52|nr:LacI family DNA-binding transcriptional regulator [Microbacterium indicum]